MYVGTDVLMCMHVRAFPAMSAICWHVGVIGVTYSTSFAIVAVYLESTCDDNYCKLHII